MVSFRIHAQVCVAPSDFCFLAAALADAAECSFAPKLNDNPQLSETRPRYMLVHEQTSSTSTSREHGKLSDQANCSFQPRTNSKDAKILQRPTLSPTASDCSPVKPTPFHNRTDKSHAIELKPRAQKVARDFARVGDVTECTFSPKINEKSRVRKPGFIERLRKDLSKRGKTKQRQRALSLFHSQDIKSPRIPSRSKVQTKDSLDADAGLEELIKTLSRAKFARG